MVISMEDRDLYFETLKVAQKISDCGPAIVNELQVREKKRLYSLIVEAFRSFSAFSRLIQMRFLVQGNAVLRLLVEETSKITILVEHPELYDSFVEHCKVREEVLDMTQKERKLKVMERFGLSKAQYDNALSFLDYGWIKPISKEGKYGYHEMLKVAHGETSAILKWVDNLDQFIHQNVDSLSFTNEGFGLFELDSIYLACITFEHLFTAFCNFIGKRSKVYEEEFWPLYDKMLKPGDVIN